MAIRYIVNDTIMDVAAVDVPGHIGVRDSGLGYGNRCLILDGGATIEETGVAAFRQVYPDLRVTADRIEASRLCGLKWITPHKGGRTVKKSTDVTPEVSEMLAHLWQHHNISLGDIVAEAVKVKYQATT